MQRRCGGGAGGGQWQHRHCCRRRRLERGIGRETVWAFGDMPNDLPMLDWAGRGVAVANAHEDVLAAADDRCAANDEDGVAEYLARHLL